MSGGKASQSIGSASGERLWALDGSNPIAAS